MCPAPFFPITLFASLVAQTVKNLLAIQAAWVQSLGWEDPLEKEMATHSSILAWRNPWTEEPGGLQSVGSQSRTQLSDFTSLQAKGPQPPGHRLLAVC